MNVPENGIFPFAIQEISRKKVCRGGCEVRKGKERKGRKGKEGKERKGREGKGKALGKGGMVGR